MIGQEAIPFAERLPAAKRRHDEDALQRSVVGFLRLALPPDAFPFAVPNGGMRSPREAARLKGMGVTPGVPDLCIVYRGRPLFIELKTPRGVVSPAQRAVTSRLLYCGALVWVCRSLEEVEAALREVQVPLRARAA